MLSWGRNVRKDGWGTEDDFRIGIDHSLVIDGWCLFLDCVC